MTDVLLGTEQVRHPWDGWLVTTEEALAECVATYMAMDEFVIDTETMPGLDGSSALDPRGNEVFWIGLAGAGGTVHAIPFGHPKGRLLLPEHHELVLPPEHLRKVLKSGKLSNARVRRKVPDLYDDPPQQLWAGQVFEALRPLLFSKRRKIGHNIKFDLASISKYYANEVIPTPYGDTGVLQHMLNENLLRYGLDDLIKRNFDVKAYAEAGKLGKKGVQNFPFLTAAKYVCLDVRWTWLLWSKLRPRLGSRGFDDLYRMEMRVLRVLLDMEAEGALINEEALRRYGEYLTEQVAETAAMVFAYNDGHAFDLNSNEQKAKFVYVTRKHKVRHRTDKTQMPSTKAEHLARYDTDPAVALLLKYADLQKERSTYVEGLLPLLRRGRLHADFVQHGTKTGRFSCRKPNLQNIPRPGDEGTVSVREMFVAPPGYKLVVADYDQVELRLIAHFSRDKRMLEIFRAGVDIHAGTAAALMHLDVATLTKEQRQVGKGINFAIGFGAGDEKVAQLAGCSVKEAEGFVELHRKTFTGIYAWKSSELRRARSRKPPYVETYLGRRRRLPELHSSSYGLRGRAERQAINSVIQGSAADIIKLAMIKVHQAFEGTDMRILLQVHDELVCAVPEDQVEEAMEKVRSAMFFDALRVPLLVSVSSGDSWKEAK